MTLKEYQERAGEFLNREFPTKHRWIKRLVIGENWKATLIRTAVLGVSIYVVFGLFCRPLWVVGDSMEPTVLDRTVQFANMVTFKVKTPERFQIIVAKAPAEKYYLKRVVGLPGEKVEYREGKLYINDKLMPEPHITERGLWNVRPVELNGDSYFVAGDNRAIPARFHVMGTISRKDILGVMH